MMMEGVMLILTMMIMTVMGMGLTGVIKMMKMTETTMFANKDNNYHF